MNFSNPIEQFVKPHYLLFLGGNFLSLQDNELSSFVTSVQKAISEIEPDQIERLLKIAWREQLTGAWFAGLKNWSQFTEQIGGLLIPSATCYAGEGYCFALARFADQPCIDYLTLYLDEYLPQIDKYYDQLWAMSALIWIDKVKGTNHSMKYLEPNGLWESFVADKIQNGGWSLEHHNQHFERIMTFCDKWFGNSNEHL